MFRHCRDGRPNVRVRILWIPVPVQVDAVIPDPDIKRVAASSLLSICWHCDLIRQYRPRFFFRAISSLYFIREHSDSYLRRPPPESRFGVSKHFSHAPETLRRRDPGDLKYLGFRRCRPGAFGTAFGEPRVSTCTHCLLSFFIVAKNFKKEIAAR